MATKSAKKMLALLRKGDFAHPGETDAIEMALQPIAKNPAHLILDVGCGLGGTAQYVQAHHWGQVTGLDLDKELIQYARHQYPEISFVLGNILQAEQLLQEKFDVIYSFSAFFCFSSQQQALKTMHLLAKPQAQLILFDYSRFNSEDYPSPFPWSTTASRFHPIYLPELEQWLLESGWRLKKTLDVSEHFAHWYTQLMQLFAAQRTEITKRFDTDLLNKMVTGYGQLLSDIQAKIIGGVIIYADKYR